MFDIGVISYLTGGIFFLGLALLLVTGWRGRLQGGLLVTAALASCAWCLALAWVAADEGLSFRLVYAAEVLRAACWLVFLAKLLSFGFRGTVAWGSRYLIHGLWLGVLVLGLAPMGWAEAALVAQARLTGLLVLALLGMVLVEQLYRNSDAAQRWALKYLCLGVGGMFVYDFILYADAMMFMRLDEGLWQARGVVNAMAVPLIAVSTARNPEWSLDVFVSRRFMFYGTTLAGAGLLLLAIAAGGYYVRLYGGEWGVVAQVVLLAASAIVLFVALFSGQVRAHIKVFLSKHFYNYKYDYRDEWIRFIGTLAEGDQGAAIRQRVIQALAQIVDSTNGRLWVRSSDESGDFVYAADWNRAPPVTVLGRDDPLLRFLETHNWVIDLHEWSAAPERYAGLDIPSWLAEDAGAWLVIPLRHHERLTGLVLLGRPRAPRETNWEDRDLLKTAGQQAGGYLALLDASEALTQARQFEAFNRLSAYVVHDLKNMVAQLALVVSNADRHRHNPAFMEDAIRTVDNTVGRMNRLLAQLRKGRFDSPAAGPVRLEQCLAEVVARRAASSPRPVLHCPSGGAPLRVLADAERLSSVLEHLVQNAQEATRPDGTVEVRLAAQGSEIRIAIRDDGVGMTDDFVRSRLFRPFDTTKGNAGMGIGVYEAREFVHGMGGRMEVASAPGEGSTFTILLPAAPADILESGNDAGDDASSDESAEVVN